MNTNVREHQRELARRNCFCCAGVPTQPASRKRCSTPPVLMPSKNVWLESKNIFRPPMSQKPLPSKLRKNCVLLIVSRFNHQRKQQKQPPSKCFSLFFLNKTKIPSTKILLNPPVFFVKFGWKKQ